MVALALLFESVVESEQINNFLWKTRVGFASILTSY